MIDISIGRNLRLDNVVSYKCVFPMQNAEISQNNADIIISKLENQIKMKGAKVVGPLIEHSVLHKNLDGGIDYSMALMFQADKKIENVDMPFSFHPSICIRKCMFARFVGYEEDLHLAYKKMEVTAYEMSVRLKDNSYTVYVDTDIGNEKSTIDIFIEIEQDED